jgi:hypothetical protein
MTRTFDRRKKEVPGRTQGVWPLAVTIAAALVLVAAMSAVELGRPSITSAQAPNAMAVDADPSTPGVVDTARTVTGGGSFNVSINVTAAATLYDTYQWKLSWDQSVLALSAGAHSTGDLFGSCAAFTATASDVATSCGPSEEEQNFTGAVDTLTFHCVASGTSSVHLVSPAEDGVNGTTTFAAGGAVETDLTDATITCDVPAPTNTPTTTPTTTPTGTVTSTATPTPTYTPTATPTSTSTVTPTPTSTAAEVGSPTPSGQAGTTAWGTPSPTAALVRANTTIDPSPQATPAGAVQGQSSSQGGVTSLPSAGDGGKGPPIPWRPVMAATIILLVGAGSWVLYYGLREATAED